MRTTLIGAVTCGLLLLANTVGAGDAGQRHLEAAREARKSGDVKVAAIGFGKAAAAAQKAGDLEAEAAIAEDLRDFLASVREEPREEYDVDRVGAVIAVLGELDHGHLGAFVSSQNLGTYVLRTAVASGNHERLPIVAAFLAEQAKAKGAGEAISVLASAAMSIAKDETATEPLVLALATARTHDWHDLTSIVGVELTARTAAAGLADEARAALTETVAPFAGDLKGTQAHVDFWNFAIGRLGKLPAEVRQPLLDLGNERSGGGGAGGAGGAGADAGTFGGDSKLGKGWRKLSKSKPFVTVAREAEGLDVRHAFDKKFQQRVDISHRESNVDDGGVALWFHGASVALLRVALEQSGDGLPGASASRRPFVAYYHLADGETWGVSKTGAVSIR